MKIIIYTDGSCLGNPGPGGYCAILKAFKDNTLIKEKIIKGAQANTTNNQMELKALVEALKHIKKPNQHIIIYTDSKYVADGINKWLKNWIAKDFAGVKNSDLWKELYKLLKLQNVEVNWVKAHQNDKTENSNNNNLCDKIAKEEAMKILLK